MKRKKFLAISISTLLVALGFSPAVVMAQTDQTTQQQTQTTLSDADKQKLLQRLTERKAQAKLRLTTAQKTRLKTRCKNAQGVIAPVKARVQGIETGRSKVYSGIVDKLEDLSTKLKNRNANTAELDAAITTLAEKVTTFSNDLAAYKQAVADLTDMECETDTEAFKASVDAARALLDKVNQDAKDIRAYVKDTIKPILATIREQLANADTGDGQ